MGNFLAPQGGAPQQAQSAPQMNPFIAALFHAANNAGAFNQQMPGGMPMQSMQQSIAQPQYTQPAWMTSGPNAGVWQQMNQLGGAGVGNVAGSANIAEQNFGAVGAPDWMQKVTNALGGAQDASQFQTLQQMFRNQILNGTQFTPPQFETQLNQLNGMQFKQPQAIGEPIRIGAGMLPLTDVYGGIDKPVNPMQNSILQQQPQASLVNQPLPGEKILGGTAGQNPWTPRRNKFGAL